MEPLQEPSVTSRGAHTVQFFSDDRRLARSVSTFLHDGLAVGERAVVIAEPQRIMTFADALRGLGAEPDALVEAGDLVVLDAERTLDLFFVNRQLDARLFRKHVGGVVDALMGPERKRVRAFGEMVAILVARQCVDAAIELEALWNDLLAERPVSLLCAYPLSSFEKAEMSAAFQDVCASHHHTFPAADWNTLSSTERDLRVAMLEQQAAALQIEVGARRRSEARLAIVSSASELLASSIDYDTTLDNVIGLTVPALGDFGYLDVVERRDDSSNEPSADRVRRVARAYEDTSREALLRATKWSRSERMDMNLCALSSGGSALHAAIDEGWLARAAASPDDLELMKRLDFGSMITVPLRHRGGLLGGLTLFYRRGGRVHSYDELALAEEIARRAAAAVDNARLVRELASALHRQSAADRRKDEFLALLGHELRNPLAPIMTALHLMDLRGDPSARREREVIRRQATHLTRLVDDLLDVARLARGKVELRKAPIEVAQIVATAVETASPLLEQRAHHLTLQVPREGLAIDVDSQRLAQVVANLLTNAARYTDPGGRIEVAAWREGAEIVLEVLDNGRGIAPEVMPTVFDAFVQGGQGIDRREGGLGLGLALVKTLTELHAGRVEVRSAGPGRGSAFTLRLPAAVGHAVSEVTGTASPALTRRVAGLPCKGRVLVVDDNPDVADTIAEALREIGFDVEVAPDGPTALVLARRTPPRIALLDLGLPVMDGFELARKLRAMSGVEPLRLIAVTGYGQESDRARSMDAGFDEHLVKPVTLDVLQAAMGDQTVAVDRTA